MGAALSRSLTPAKRKQVVSRLKQRRAWLKQQGGGSGAEGLARGSNSQDRARVAMGSQSSSQNGLPEEGSQWDINRFMSVYDKKNLTKT